MFIFKESGRLGNQLFQYTALKSLCQQSDKLILLGFRELQIAFDGIDAKIINENTSRLERSLYDRLYPYLDLLSNQQLISCLYENEQRSLYYRLYPYLDLLSNQQLISCLYENEQPHYKIIEKKGFFNSIKFVKTAYFQNEELLCQKAIKNLVLKESILSSTKQLLNTISLSNTNIFVHIRRGDYLSWINKDSPAVLPASYYKKCIDIICSEISNPFFIFASDDPCYVQDIFGDIKNSYIEDFALMSHCQGGILSASSFSWWAAYFSHLQNSNSIFLAPKYWIGHRSGAWYPAFIESKFLKYIDV
jgi:Glycosyl transferase family 11